MISVIQRVTQASVAIDDEVVSKIDRGLLVLLGIAHADDEEDILWLTRKIVQLRIFDDETGVMNKNVKQVAGDILLVSQFTLQASTKKGNRPSYLGAAPPALAEPIYLRTISAIEKELGRSIQTGRFGALMQVGLINDGPTTLLIDTQHKR